MTRARPLAVFMFALVAALALTLTPLAGADDDDDDGGGGGGDLAYCAPPGSPEPGQCSRFQFTIQEVTFDFDASSGPMGESPVGTYREVRPAFDEFFEYQITCLQVTGNSASFGGLVTDSNFLPVPMGQGVAHTVVDNTPPAFDLISSHTVIPTGPPAANTPNCGSLLPPNLAVTAGDIVVQDNIGGGGDGEDDDEDDDDDDEDGDGDDDGDDD